MGQWSHKTSQINAQDEGNFDACLGPRNKNICVLYFVWLLPYFITNQVLTGWAKWGGMQLVLRVLISLK